VWETASFEDNPQSVRHFPPPISDHRKHMQRQRLAFFTRQLGINTHRAYASMSRRGATSIPHDVQDFLEDYPGQDDDPRQSDNLHFYQNTLRCRPDALVIDELHDKLVQWIISLYDVEIQTRLGGLATTTPLNASMASFNGCTYHFLRLPRDSS
jgi:hypothetical protein